MKTRDYKWNTAILQYNIILGPRYEMLFFVDGSETTIKRMKIMNHHHHHNHNFLALDLIVAHILFEWAHGCALGYLNHGDWIEWFWGSTNVKLESNSSQKCKIQIPKSWVVMRLWEWCSISQNNACLPTAQYEYVWSLVNPLSYTFLLTPKNWLLQLPSSLKIK